MEMALGFLSVFLGLNSILMAIILTRNTNILVKTEDERAKQIIEEGKERTQQMLEKTQLMIDEGNKRTQQMLEKTQLMIDEGN
ncbi:MAG: hypothetical protein NC833_06610, partial [Candidatus Omnitrophica bacterium]|nr:hypothetical protein [Candidatus Omnitrophota bacterium]